MGLRMGWRMVAPCRRRRTRLTGRSIADYLRGAPTDTTQEVPMGAAVRTPLASACLSSLICLAIPTAEAVAQVVLPPRLAEQFSVVAPASRDLVNRDREINRGLANAALAKSIARKSRHRREAGLSSIVIAAVARRPDLIKPIIAAASGGGRDRGASGDLRRPFRCASRDRTNRSRPARADQESAGTHQPRHIRLQQHARHLRAQTARRRLWLRRAGCRQSLDRAGVRQSQRTGRVR